MLKEIMSQFRDELTPVQRQYLEAYLNFGTYQEVAEIYKVNESSVRQCINRIKQNYIPKLNKVPETMDDPVPGPFSVKGTSTYYGPDGERRGHWVKTDRDKDTIYQDLLESITELSQQLPQQEPQLDPEITQKDILAVYPLGDPHIGMLTYKPETGANWDLAIAEKKFLPLFDKLVRSAPPCDEALIIDLGDFWHYDAMDQRTVRSGHKVDADGRPSKMVQVGYRIMMQMIMSALQHHKKVHVKIMPGNHDDLGSIFLRVSLAHIFANEPRVVIDPSPNVFQYFVWGSNLIGIHHGHECKLANLPMVMAADMPEQWGSAVHRYWYVGHFHHDSTREYNGKELHGCKVETFRTIIPSEAYAHAAGYRAGQDGKVIVLHKEYGEVQRHTINIDQIR